MKITAISDTHTIEKKFLLNIEPTDVLIHCGDFSSNEKNFYEFLDWFSKQEAIHKILVAGNHDMFAVELGYEKTFEICKEKGIIYLQDTSVEIDGIKFYGSPWTPVFFNWFFMKSEQELMSIYKKIPEDTVVLITHGPKRGILDRVVSNGSVRHVGSSALANRIEYLTQLKFHFFGHIHEQYGISKETEYENYTSVNASIIYDGYHKTFDRGPKPAITVFLEK